MKKRASATLNSFVKGECANYDNYHKICVYGYACKVLKGERCAYFEKAVLGPPDYKFRSPGYDYDKIFEQYAQINTRYIGKLHKVNVRKCDCGESLEPRRRYCEKCQIKRRRKTYRNFRRLKRNS